MINTLTRSTMAYLALLEKMSGGNVRHPVSHIALVSNGYELIENKVWPVITCILPHHLKFPPDFGATLVQSHLPASAILAQILKYDPRTGYAKIALEENPTDATGHLVIDFKWLIKRLIQWLGVHGTNISNPFFLAEHHSTISQFKNVGAMSDEQTSSAENLLENPVAYVWGPPGTGKTRHVLAETVAHLMRNGKRVLVTAATNLAVDNALDAILRVDPVHKKEVLRIGVPSDEFRDQWPECCESKAFDQEMANLQQQLIFLQTRIDAARQQTELSDKLQSVTENFIKTGTAFAAAKLEFQLINERHVQITTELGKLELLCAGSEQQLNETKQGLSALDLVGKKNEISILEREQTKLMGERQESEYKLAHLSLFARLFTRKKTLLIKLRDYSDQRLDSVETTLNSIRKTYHHTSHEGLKFGVTIAELEKQFFDLEELRGEHALLLHGIAIQHTVLNERIDSIAKINYDSELLMAAIQQELVNIASMGLLPSDQNEVNSIIAECSRVQDTMKKISQDLSDKLVLGMTLDGFVGLTMNQALTFDHVVVDEAGYAPLAKVIPLCSLKCPISLLGDHCQLPPVYEGDNHVESECYWGTSALYIEDAFDPDIGTSFMALLERSKMTPRFENLRRSQLTRSYRFGPALANLLDRHFYKMGLCSNALTPTSIELIHCLPINQPLREKRENPGECAAIVERVERWLNWTTEDKGTLAVISPYRAQVNLLRQTLWNRFRTHPDFDLLDILTVHKAQGREWDTVFFSVSDGRLQGNGPWFSDTSKTEGRLLVNTAISRAKSHLRIFCDKDFWVLRLFPESLLSELSK